MAYTKLSFYTIATGNDGRPTETTLLADVTGRIEKDSNSNDIQDSANFTRPILRYVFLPDNKVLSSSVFGTKATDGTIVYSVEDVEDFNEHQEVYLRKQNAK